MTLKTTAIESAFVQLRQSLRGYLRRRLPDPSLADDLVQDIFLKALLSQKAGRRIENLTGWLYSAMRTTLIDHYRSRGTPPKEIDENIPDEDSDELEILKELACCLRPFIEALPPLYSETLIATELEGSTMRELAEKQGVSVSAIKSRAARGRVMLKQALLDCCHIEMAGGTVADYHRKPAPGCDGQCA